MYRLRMGNPTQNFLNLFEEIFDESSYATSRKCPVHDVIENDKEYLIEMDLAGVKKEDVSIEHENETLTIETERKKDETLNYRRKESYVGKYKRSFILPDNVDIENITAALSDGVLTITIPKLEEEIKKKKQIVIR